MKLSRYQRGMTVWSMLMIVILVIGGLQMLMMGMLGEYLWRTLDEARQRPRYLIESTVNLPTPRKEEIRE